MKSVKSVKRQNAKAQGRKFKNSTPSHDKKQIEYKIKNWNN